MFSKNTYDYLQFKHKSLREIIHIFPILIRLVYDFKLWGIKLFFTIFTFIGRFFIFSISNRFTLTIWTNMITTRNKIYYLIRKKIQHFYFIINFIHNFRIEFKIINIMIFGGFN